MTDRTPEPMSASRNAAVQCASCGRAVSRKARQQRFCSERCREREKKARQRGDRGHWGQGTGCPRNPHKFVNENKGLQSPNRRPRVGISAPAAIVERELFAGRRWEQAVSDDGVQCLVVRAGVREAAI